VKQLGFTQNWRFEGDEGEALVAQVVRPGIEIILTAEPFDKTGKGLIFISLDEDVLCAASELEGRGVDAKDGHWGLPDHGYQGPRR